MDVIDATELDDAGWDELCREADGAWFWHTSGWRDYTLAYRPALRSLSLAFAVAEAGQPIALVPLMVEDNPEATGRRFSFGGDSCWSPALVGRPDLGRSAMAMRTALEHVDSLAAEHGVDSVSFRISPLGAATDLYLPLFLACTSRAGFADTSICSQVVDLDVDASSLRSAMTKGHRADITRGRRFLDVTVSTGDKAEEDFSAYRAMHAMAAGRVTRPAKTFELMEGWLASGSGALLKATHDDVPVGFTYLLLHGDGAYYASAANHPEHTGDPIGHVLHATAIDWLQQRGQRRYELGLQQFGPLPHDVPSAKEMGIARFKRGFGGRTVPLVVREKWYDGEAFDRTWKARAEAYVRAVWPTGPPRSSAAPSADTI